jgi:hypothetical protein
LDPIEEKKSYHCLQIRISGFIIIPGNAHHAEGLVDPKVRAKKKDTDFGYPRACRIRKHQKIEIGHRSSFSKRDKNS